MFKKLLVTAILASSLFAGSTLAYTVQKGDTISGISKRFGISQQEIVQENGILNPNKIFVGQNLTLGLGIPEVLGASRNYVEIPDSTLYSGAIVGDTSITLDQLVDIYGNSLVMADFGDKGYGRINPEGNNISESFSFTGITANADGTKTLTGIKHVLAKSPYTETAGLTRSHGIGSTVRVTNTAGFYNDFTNKANNETIVGRWLYSILPEANGNILATTTNQFVTKQYADNLSITGAPTSTESTAGRVKLGTQTQMASSTYDANDPTVVYTRYTTSTPGTAGEYVPVTESDGKLNQTFIDLTDSFTWSGTHTFNGSSPVAINGGGFISSVSSTLLATSTFFGDTNGIKTLSNSVTSTGEAIDGSSTPQAVSISTTTGNYYKADGNDITRVQFVGFITSNASAGTRPYITTEGIVSGFSGLTVGANYYISDTAGSISKTPGTIIIPVGEAITSGKILITKGRKVATGTISHSTTAGATEDITVTIGFNYSVLLTEFTINSKTDGSTCPYKGNAIFKGTTLLHATGIAGNCANTAITTTNLPDFFLIDTLASLNPGFGTNYGRSTHSINSVSSDSFVSRLVNTTVGGSGATLTATINYVAME